MSYRNYENEDYSDNSSQSSFEDENLVGGAYNTPYSHSAGHHRSAMRGMQTNGGGFHQMMHHHVKMLSKKAKAGRKPRGGISWDMAYNPNMAFAMDMDGTAAANRYKQQYGYGKRRGRKPHGGAWWDVFDPNKNGVANAFDPNKNGVANAFDPNKNGVANALANTFDPNKNGVAQGFNNFGSAVNNEFTNPNSALAQGTLSQFTDPNSILRGYVVPALSTAGMAAGMVLAPEVLLPYEAALAAASAAGYANTGANLLGFGKRRGRKPHGGAWYNDWNDFKHAGQQGYKYGKQGYDALKFVSPYLKPLLSTYGGEYGQSASNGLNSIGLGKRRGRKPRGGAWWDVFDPQKNGVAQGFNQLGSAVNNEFTNPNSALANFYNSNLAPAIADTRGAIGIGKRRGRKPRGGAWWDVFDPNKNGVANAFDPNKNGVANFFANDHIAGIPNRALKMAGIGGSLSTGKYKMNGQLRGGAICPMDMSPRSIACRKGGKTSRNQLMGAFGVGGTSRSGGARSARGAIVSQVMRERGVPLAHASRIVKHEGLY